MKLADGLSADMIYKTDNLEILQSTSLKRVLTKILLYTDNTSISTPTSTYIPHTQSWSKGG